jgi:hypothetical protein
MRTDPNNPILEWEGTLPALTGKHPTEYKLSGRRNSVSITLSSGSGLYLCLWVDSLPHLLNLYRDLGELLDSLQPGLTSPLPDGDPSEVDAMKVVFVADQIRKGIE